MKTIVMLVLSTLIISGCNSNQSVEDAQNFAQCTFPDSPETEAPAWICDVMPVDLAAGALGYAKKSAAGISIQRKLAVNDARVTLASQFQTEVNNLFRQAIESQRVSSEVLQSEQVIETFENVTKNVVSRSISNSKLIVSQVSPAGGLYVLVGMDEESFNNNLDKVVDAANSDSQLWDKFNSEKAEKELSSVLSSLKTM
ncbi:hypothetical protein HGP28_03720 [Vibrio sp. SM6]|uniref:LPP20 lipoprotein n=1 Tax=Vibrio agarilyticus TaxID=2726741 RepID=A0A7X8TNW9_9VIBR|nr:LPP20 family lipoprotein [Vibrio agarilyticus]NLS11999.1 hypothetical protein [Vibrio agarilyticus]